MTVRRFRVIFDPDAIAEDLAHATKAARGIGEQAISRLQRDGITLDQLRGCEAEGHDGTRLPGCAKTYLPQPNGRCGMVFALRGDEHGPFLAYLAFGVRHPPRGSRSPSVYQIADRRLNGSQDA